DAEYVLLDATSTIFPVHLFPIEGLTPEAAYVEYVRRLLEDDGFAVSDAEDGWLLLVRDLTDRGGDPALTADVVLTGISERFGLGN
ncbi:MAG: hypothetical protein MUF84_13430, partial [Anaerolineae bacterium]|nr:hypothetical protein [Anaerolineae bacterium]